MMIQVTNIDNKLLPMNAPSCTDITPLPGAHWEGSVREGSFIIQTA